MDGRVLGCRHTDAVNQDVPFTVSSLAADLRALGLVAGDTVMVHSSMRSVGFVVGDVQAVVGALLAVVGVEGTLVVPTHTPHNSDPVDWRNPPVPEAWWPVIRTENPGFDPVLTPSRWVGVLPEAVRRWPGAVRSAHPQVSVAALGAGAVEVAGVHPLGDGLGDGSPLGVVYRRDGKVLLLGCGHDSNTSLHLAECRQVRPPRSDHGSAVRGADGVSRWVTWSETTADESDFVELGAAFEATGAVSVGRVGGATARLMSQRALVDFATVWIRENRPSWGGAGSVV